MYQLRRLLNPNVQILQSMKLLRTEPILKGAAVCPVDRCIPDDDNIESEDEVLKKKQFLHND